MIGAVVFDVGETLVDETSSFGAWADWLGVPRLTFFGVLGGVIERGEHHRRVFEILRPGFDLEVESERRRRAGCAPDLSADDLYPDAIGCLRALRARGLWLGIAGNQPAWAAAALAGLGLEVDGLATSEGWGVEKPSPEFFARVVGLAGRPAAEVAYVGDRVDNDVLPAADAGMSAVFIRRGPWGHAHARRPEAGRARLRIDTLAELPAALAGLEGVP